MASGVSMDGFDSYHQSSVIHIVERILWSHPGLGLEKTFPILAST